MANVLIALSALMLLVGRQKGIWPVKKHGGWWRWAVVSPDGVALSRMVSVSASVNLSLHHKVQKFSSGTGSPGWSWKKGRKTVVAWCVVIIGRLLVAAALRRLPVTSKGNDADRLKPRLHDTTCCQTGLTTGSIVYTASCQTGCTTPFDNRLNEQWLFVKHGCQTRLYNRFDNRVERTAVHSSRLLNRVCQTSCTTRFDNRLNEQCCSFNTVLKPVVKPV